MEERDILIKLRNGDENAFRIIVDQYQKMVLSCTYKFLRNKESAEDITQEVFLAIYESIHTFRADSKLSTWIYRIAITKSLNYMKSTKRQKRYAIFTSLLGKEEIEETIAAPAGTDQQKQLENKDRARVLTWALEKLPDNQRIAFTLCKYEEMSYEEISSILKSSIPAVESLIHRARTNLRKTLYNYYKKNEH